MIRSRILNLTAFFYGMCHGIPMSIEDCRHATPKKKRFNGFRT